MQQWCRHYCCLWMAYLRWRLFSRASLICHCREGSLGRAYQQDSSRVAGAIDAGVWRTCTCVCPAEASQICLCRESQRVWLGSRITESSKCERCMWRAYSSISLPSRGLYGWAVVSRHSMRAGCSVAQCLFWKDVSAQDLKGLDSAHRLRAFKKVHPSLLHLQISGRL